jgi:antitoxin component of MazEF toxin-antitoxin module
MLKHNPKANTEKPGKKQREAQEVKTDANQSQTEVFEPFYYDLDDLLKGVTPDNMQEEISTGPAVGKEII